MKDDRKPKRRPVKQDKTEPKGLTTEQLADKLIHDLQHGTPEYRRQVKEAMDREFAMLRDDSTLKLTDEDRSMLQGMGISADLPVVAD